MRGLSLVVVSRGYSLLCLCCGARTSHYGGFSCCRAQTPEHGSVAAAHKLCCPEACGVFPDQGSNPRPLHWQADSFFFFNWRILALWNLNHWTTREVQLSSSPDKHFKWEIFLLLKTNKPKKDPHQMMDFIYKVFCVCAKSLQLYPILFDPMDHNSPGSSVHGILQAGILEQVATPSSRGSYWPRDRTHISFIFCIGRQVLYH